MENIFYTPEKISVKNCNIKNLEKIYAMKMRNKRFEEIFIHLKKFPLKMRYKKFGKHFLFLKQIGYVVQKICRKFLRWKCDMKNLEKISEMKMWYKRFGENFMYVKKLLSKMGYKKFEKNFLLVEKISKLKMRYKKFREISEMKIWQTFRDNFIHSKKFLSKIRYEKLVENFIFGEKISQSKMRYKKFG